MITVFSSVRPKGYVILAAAANTACEMGITVVATSGTDGKHMEGSLHYSGNAIDFRKWNLKDPERILFLEVMRNRLGPDYQVIEEDDHIHVEWDPPLEKTDDPNRPVNV